LKTFRVAPKMLLATFLLLYVYIYISAELFAARACGSNKAVSS